MARKLTDYVQLKLRVRLDLRRRLEREAKKRDHSANNEAVERLENSFAEPRRLEEIFGGESNVALFRSFASLIERAESTSGKRWQDDAATRREIQGAMLFQMDMIADPAKYAPTIAKLLMQTPPSPGAGLFSLPTVKPEDSK